MLFLEAEIVVTVDVVVIMLSIYICCLYFCNYAKDAVVEIEAEVSVEIDALVAVAEIVLVMIVIVV